MKNKKRFLSLVLVLALGMGLMLTACSDSGDSGNTGSPNTGNSTPPVQSQPTTPSEPSNNSPEPAASDWTPTKPINIINYVAAGGGMDVATRKFAEIAAKYTDATFVVDNKTGAGGLVGMDYVLDQPADGYTIFAGTVSNIAYIVSNEEDTDHYVWGFEWIQNIMADPISIMVREEDNITLEELIAESKQMGGSQIWVGPSTGGIKHVIGMKLWSALGIEATWVPFESGPLSLTALLGGQGRAAVGNPNDVEGRALRNLVIAGPSLPLYPDVPNFSDLGFPELDSVSMWRGFAVKKGTPPEMIAWFQDLYSKIAEDPEWLEFFEAKSIAVKNDRTEAFEAQIRIDIEDNMSTLKSLDMISQDYSG